MADCDRCGAEGRITSNDIHPVGYHRNVDARAGDPMDALAYLCEDCIREVFSEFAKLHDELLMRDPNQP